MSEMDVRGNEADGLLDEPAPEQAGNASINSLDNSTESPRFEDVERRHEVLSVVPFEQVIIGKLLGNTALYCGLQVTVVACAAATLTMAGEMFAAIANLTRPNDLLYITALLVAVGFASQLLTLRSVRTSLGPNGPLVQLGAGVQYISASDAKKLDRWRIGLACISAVSIVVGALNFGSGICGMDLAHRTDRVLMGHERVWFVLTGTYLALVLPILTSGWASSLLAAKQLSYDSIMVAIKHAEATNPVDHATWHAEVVLPALQLQEKMQWLSDGWGGGLQGAFVFFGFVGLALGTLIMNAQWCDGADAFYGLRPGLMRVYSCAAIAFVDSLPLLLARHVAATSSRCGRLIEKLNDARIKAGPDHNDRISWLRQSLKDVNDGQGLGVLIGHTVINGKSLGKVATTLYGGLTTAYAILLALVETGATLGTDDVNGTTAACELSALKASTINTTSYAMWTIVLEHSANCSYENITLGALLGA